MTQPSSPQDPGRGNLIRIRNLRAAALNGKGLAAALPAGFNGRWTRRHWMHASLFAMLGTLVMAIVPGFSNAMSSSAAHASAATPLTTLSLLLPPLPASARQAAHVERNNWQLVHVAKRSAERRVGKECVSTCRSRWSPYHYKKQTQA